MTGTSAVFRIPLISSVPSLPGSIRSISARWGFASSHQALHVIRVAGHGTGSRRHGDFGQRASLGESEPDTGTTFPLPIFLRLS